MTQGQLDQLLAGQLSPTEFDELRSLYGSETIRRILDGDTKLKESIVSVSALPPTSTLMDKIDRSLEREETIPRWLTFLTRWGGVLGALVLALVVASLIPILAVSETGGAGAVSPLLLSVGAILVTTLGVALYLQYGDRR